MKTKNARVKPAPGRRCSAWKEIKVLLGSDSIERMKILAAADGMNWGQFCSHALRNFSFEVRQSLGFDHKLSLKMTRPEALALHRRRKVIEDALPRTSFPRLN